MVGLWVDNYSHSEIWLELKTDNLESAIHYLRDRGTETCDELEEISGKGHWITDPGGTVFILNEGEI